MITSIFFVKCDHHLLTTDVFIYQWEISNVNFYMCVCVFSISISKPCCILIFLNYPYRIMYLGFIGRPHFVKEIRLDDEFQH